MAGRVEEFNSGMSEDEIIAKVKQSLLEKNDSITADATAIFVCSEIKKIFISESAKKIGESKKDPSKKESSEKEFQCTINYAGDITKIPKKAEDILKEILQKSEINSVTITSTTRSPADQARIMYSNLEKYGVDHQKKLYSSNGDKVIDEYSELKAAGKSVVEIKKGMENKIVEIGPQKISKHCADPNRRCVFDIAPSSIPDKKKDDFVNAIKGNVNVDKYFIPPGDPAFHLEIPL